MYVVLLFKVDGNREIYFKNCILKKVGWFRIERKESIKRNIFVFFGGVNIIKRFIWKKKLCVFYFYLFFILRSFYNINIDVLIYYNICIKIFLFEIYLGRNVWICIFKYILFVVSNKGSSWFLIEIYFGSIFVMNW